MVPNTMGKLNLISQCRALGLSAGPLGHHSKIKVTICLCAKLIGFHRRKGIVLLLNGLS